MKTNLNRGAIYDAWTRGYLNPQDIRQDMGYEEIPPCPCIGGGNLVLENEDKNRILQCVQLRIFTKNDTWLLKVEVISVGAQSVTKGSVKSWVSKVHLTNNDFHCS